MKIALIGYGKMGHEIEKIAIDRGHEVCVAIDADNQDDFESEAFKSADVAIEFTVPSVAYQNYQKCFKHDVPVVSGTTGWLDKIDEIKQQCNAGQTFFYASNFSLGVNIFFAVNKYLANIMNDFPQYDVSMVEVHHTQKLDAPSGTGISLAEDIMDRIERKEKWINEPGGDAKDLYIESIREGQVPGIHTIKYDSEVDEIMIHHSAKNRKGFALGAVIAAEFVKDNKGFLGMEDMLKF
ncbi:4-hydroxy-tetrahydrodipicolinate reductase [Saccharicrinis sp. FJH62]|uniref:4-hydroxy-tetrahydrodipicolinate reductase n=1 Tax=Saccharicrinis sp. FJH62 TaxID=3344657 RepID=UPI0035D49599